MLIALSIRDIVLIERLDLSFHAGLTVLTGETGAGKSILLDAFTLALGGRGDGSLVRHGAAQGQVTAEFDLAPDHPVRGLLAEAGIDDDGALVLRRVQHADGRTRAFVNDQSVSAQMLRNLGRRLVEIHGQHDDRALVDPASHRTLLDAYGGLVLLAEEVGAGWRRWRAARSEAAKEKDRLDEAAKEADFIRHAVEELVALAAESGEEDRLAARRTEMMRFEKIATDLADAQDAISGANSPVPGLAAAVRRLERRAGEVEALVRPAVEAIDAALNALDLARTHLDVALREADFDPHELERIEERLFALRAAGRKYACTVDDLPAVAARFADQLDALDHGAETLKGLEARAAEAEAAYRQMARDLSMKRHAAAAALDDAVNAELPPLKLERARFITECQTDEADGQADGYDRIEFWVRTNPGTRPGPMMKVASGGELARFLLALKVVLADKGSAPTLVFDEIDTGVGGAVADAIGGRLARLSGRVQVVAVTHAPQVAARAGNHFRIAKEAMADADRVATRVAPLAPDHRREEIARMLSGAEVTSEARAAADRLLKGAAAD
ncbi:DNA repair protein RecN [Ancylobacter dichloromethanicus]|uniref:DNA repair protein RecN n=1 Tax=Ancylobacter dichloromethanicus TaxID=518825 RepID=A0A9W6J477_9HYPH|nr:DNA repair protein RecN [Ancylobacter dichloromethanicus]MBS7555232.1 DNA repair protein RecN [Ancylobacter dichloromethanicus]GLK70412.1 DNA repair protein RecN [Ancylobacter dichloromethanicus]